MRLKYLIGFLILLLTQPLPAAGNGNAVLHHFFTMDNGYTSAAKRQSIQVLTSYINELRAERESFTSDEEYFRYIFYKTHRTFLKNYKKCTSFALLLITGEYDCVSASALYALLFEYLQIKYHVYELPYHVYIELEVNEQRVLLETTDAKTGFISDPERIELMYGVYLEDSKNDSSFTLVPEMNGIKKEICIKELAGLQLYNLAIAQFNERKYELASRLINQAIELYPSHRILAIKGLLALL